jgi:hypothetical protein
MLDLTPFFVSIHYSFFKIKNKTLELFMTASFFARKPETPVLLKRKSGLFYLSNKAIISGCLLLLLSGGLNAALLYDSGSLEFSTTDQSMWATGDAFVIGGSEFLGAEWVDKSATIGGITGELVTSTQPNGAWSIWNECTAACGPEPLKELVIVDKDTRFGAELDIQSSGKVGLEFGYTVNSGSVDALVDFSAQALLPDQPQDAGVYIDLDTSSSLDGGSILTQSPEIGAYVSAIMNLSGSIHAEACAFGTCLDGGADLPTIDVDQRILSIDPINIKILDGILPGDKPLVTIPLANQSLTLKAGATISDPPVPGLEVTDTFGNEIFSTFPEGPAIKTDLAKITVEMPNIGTGGALDGDGLIKSTGRDDLIKLALDLDGIATVAAGSTPLGASFDLIKTPNITFGATVDAIDVDAGPTLGITQDFEIIPTLMATLKFSNSILIDGMVGLQNSWTGAWSDLPDFSLFDTTVFSPTYFVDVVLNSDFGLDLGLSGTIDVMKLQAKATVEGFDLFKFGPLSLNGLLGMGNNLFETDKLIFGYVTINC